MIVKAVVPVDKRKCKVFLEGDFAFVLYKSEAARFHIEEGNDLPAKTYEMIEEEILLKRAGTGHYIFFSHRAVHRRR